MKIYEFFKSQGAVVVNDAADFVGSNGCYLYKPQNKERQSFDNLAGQTLVIAPHKGIVSSDVWLSCRRKLLTNKIYQPGRKAIKVWLAGKIKCGYVLKATKKYLNCKKRMSDKSCEGAGTIKVSDTETFVYNEMVEKLREFQTVSKQEETTNNPKATALKVELAQVEAEIEKLIESLTGASDILISYANVKIADLDSRRQSLIKQLAEITVAQVSPEHMLKTSELLNNWASIGLTEKRKVVDSLIVKIKATSNNVDIEWKI